MRKAILLALIGTFATPAPWKVSAQESAGVRVLVGVMDKSTYDEAMEHYLRTRNGCVNTGATCDFGGNALAGTLQDFQSAVGDHYLMSDIPILRPDPRVNSTQYLVIRAFRNGEPITNTEAGIDAITISVDGRDPRGVSFDDYGPLRWIVTPLAFLSTARHQAPVVVSITDTAGIPRNYYGARRNLLELYGIMNVNVGFWTPVGLVASSFSQSEGNDGIEFSALPLNLAWGLKWVPRERAYLGMSAIGGWTISSKSEDSSTLHTLSSGLLLDFNGFVYLGGVYVFDFATAAKDPGAMVTLGIGPQLLKLLAQ